MYFFSLRCSAAQATCCCESNGHLPEQHVRTVRYSTYVPVRRECVAGRTHTYVRRKRNEWCNRETGTRAFLCRVLDGCGVSAPTQYLTVSSRRKGGIIGKLKQGRPLKQVTSSHINSVQTNQPTNRQKANVKR